MKSVNIHQFLYNCLPIVWWFHMKIELNADLRIARERARKSNNKIIMYWFYSNHWFIRQIMVAIFLPLFSFSLSLSTCLMPILFIVITFFSDFAPFFHIHSETHTQTHAICFICRWVYDFNLAMVVIDFYWNVIFISS